MIQVSMGMRSRLPLSFLSLRIMSQQDLMRLASCCAVDWGVCVLTVRAMFYGAVHEPPLTTQQNRPYLFSGSVFQRSGFVLMYSRILFSSSSSRMMWS
jgi:hypothetical protein